MAAIWTLSRNVVRVLFFWVNIASTRRAIGVAKYGAKSLKTLVSVGEAHHRRLIVLWVRSYFLDNFSLTCKVAVFVGSDEVTEIVAYMRIQLPD